MIWIPFAVFLAGCALLFFSLVETAFALLMRLPERLQAERLSDDEGLTAYLEDPLKFFVPVRFLRGLLLVLIIVLLAQPIGTGPTRSLILLASGLAILVVVGQILPAVIVRRSPERVLELLLPPFTAVANIMGPLTAIITGWLGPAERQFRRGENGNGDEERNGDGGRDEPQERADETRLLRSVVDFGETLVREVMTPRPDIVAIQADATVDDLRALVREQEYSRLPVYTENLDNIVGIVVVKDLIQLTDPEAAGTKIATLVRKATFVPETKRVADLLREFQQQRIQLALVVDEYGGTAGLVTIEDVVEELVGEIHDEYDLEGEPIVKESEDTFVFSAKVGIDEMRERLDAEIEDGGFETVGGYVLTRVGRVPAVGERFRVDTFDIEVLEAERRRIHKVRITRLPPPDETAS